MVTPHRRHHAAPHSPTPSNNAFMNIELSSKHREPRTFHANNADMPTTVHGSRPPVRAAIDSPANLKSGQSADKSAPCPGAARQALARQAAGAGRCVRPSLLTGFRTGRASADSAASGVGGPWSGSRAPGAGINPCWASVAWAATIAGHHSNCGGPVDRVSTPKTVLAVSCSRVCAVSEDSPGPCNAPSQRRWATTPFLRGWRRG